MNTLTLHIAREGDIRKYTCIGSLVQKKYREDYPEIQNIGHLQERGGKNVEMGKDRGSRDEKVAGTFFYLCSSDSWSHDNITHPPKLNN